MYSATVNYVCWRSMSRRVADVSPMLQQALIWLDNSERTRHHTIAESRRGSVRFSPCWSMAKGYMLLFEDIGFTINACSKASWRPEPVTASIAHEIRNRSARSVMPASYCGDTGAEPQELRLTEIIKPIVSASTISSKYFATVPAQCSQNNFCPEQWLPAFVQEQNPLCGTE